LDALPPKKKTSEIKSAIVSVQERNNHSYIPPPSPSRRNSSPGLIALGTLTTDTTSKLNILRHDRHTLGMNSTQVGILKKTHKVRLTRLLQRQNGSGLKPQIRLEILRNLTNETLEGCLTDQKVGGLLIFADLTKSDGTGTVTVGLLDTSGGGGGLASGLGGELFAGGLASGGFTCGLLGAVVVNN
jgi:hypothetical protein